MPQMLCWLNANASAIQAVAAVAALAVTAVLAVLTGKYVRLTKAIASAAVEQANQLRETTLRESARAHAGVQMLAARLHAALTELDVPTPPDAIIRRYSLFTSGDVDQLETLARAASIESLAKAMPVALSLRAIRGLVDRVQATNPGFGYRYGAKENEEYAEAVRTAREGLVELRDSVHCAHDGKR